MKIYNFSKKIFIPFHISTYKNRPPQKHPNFRIKSAGSSYYRGRLFFPPPKKGSINNIKKGKTILRKNLEFIQITRPVKFSSSLSPRCCHLGLQQRSSNSTCLVIPAKACPYLIGGQESRK
jgi:hypothetical protein